MLAEALRLKNTVTSVQLAYNGLGEGGGRALAETLRLNTTRRSTSKGMASECNKSQHFVRPGA